MDVNQENAVHRDCYIMCLSSLIVFLCGSFLLTKIYFLWSYDRLI